MSGFSSGSLEVRGVMVALAFGGITCVCENIGGSRNHELDLVSQHEAFPSTKLRLCAVISKELWVWSIQTSYCG